MPGFFLRPGMGGGSRETQKIGIKKFSQKKGPQNIERYDGDAPPEGLSFKTPNGVDAGPTPTQGGGAVVYYRGGTFQHRQFGKTNLGCVKFGRYKIRGEKWTFFNFFGALKSHSNFFKITIWPQSIKMGVNFWLNLISNFLHNFTRP